MSSSAIELRPPRAQSVIVTDDSLTVDLVDGRTVSVPLSWYPRLSHATSSERASWRLIGQGEGIHRNILTIANSLVKYPSQHMSARSVPR
jgi:hypothetical protein